MDEVKKIIISEFESIPRMFYVGQLLLLSIGSIAFIIVNRGRAVRNIIRLLLFEYVLFIYGVTVFFRKGGRTEIYMLTPFVSYVKMFQGEASDMLFDILVNVALFMPVGFLWGAQSSLKPPKRRWFVVLLLGLCLSTGIELFQLFLNKGFVEIDDIIHNTLGCVIGFALWQGVVRMAKTRITSIQPAKKF